MSLKIFVEEMSKKVTEIYSLDPVSSKNIFKTMSSSLLRKDYKTVAIYLYKREILKLPPDDIINWLSSNENNIHPSLYNSFLIKVNNRQYTEISNYLIKNDHVYYFYKGKKIHNVLSTRRETRKSN